MTRLLGIPAAVVVLVALPGVVSQATKTKDEPPAKEAVLTVNLEGSEGAAGHPYPLAVTADGDAPLEPATLRDATGLHTGKLKPATGCASPTRVAFPGASSTWCLRLEDIAKGYELSGAVSDSSEKVGARTLKLTVNRRDAFWPLPFWVIVAGLLSGLGLALFKAPFRRSIRGTVLGTQLRKNEEAKGAAQIVDLTRFVRDRLAAGETVDEVTPKVAALRKNGPGIAEQVRKALRDALEEHRGALAKYPLWSAAGKEAHRKDNRVEDFYDSDGEPKPHPAVEFLQVVEELAADREYIAKLKAAIALLDVEVRQAPLEALARAELVAQEATEPSDVRRVAALLDAARDSVETAQAKTQVGAIRRRGLEAPTPAAPKALSAAPVPPLPPAATELGGAELVRTGIWALQLTVAAMIAVPVFALFTIKQSVYDPKLTFSSYGDYFTLFSTALASAAAGSIILLLSYWSPVSVSED